MRMYTVEYCAPRERWVSIHEAREYDREQRKLNETDGPVKRTYVLLTVLTFPTRPRLKDLPVGVLLLDLFAEISAVGHRDAARFERGRGALLASGLVLSLSLFEIDPQLRRRPLENANLSLLFLFHPRIAKRPTKVFLPRQWRSSTQCSDLVNKRGEKTGEREREREGSCVIIISKKYIPAATLWMTALERAAAKTYFSDALTRILNPPPEPLPRSRYAAT